MLRVVTQFQMIVKASVAGTISRPSSPTLHRTVAANLKTLQLPYLPSHKLKLMRFPSFPQFVRALHTISNTTSAFIRSNPAGALGRTLYNRPQRVTIQRSMPNIPFLGALFGSSSSMADNTNYPASKPEGEWQAQLSPGMFCTYTLTNEEN